MRCSLIICFGYSAHRTRRFRVFQEMKMITIIHCKSDFLRMKEGCFLVLSSAGSSWISYEKYERLNIKDGAIVVFNREHYSPELDMLPWRLGSVIEQYSCRHIVGGTGHNDPFTVRDYLTHIIKEWMRFPWTEDMEREWFSLFGRNLRAYDQNLIMSELSLLIREFQGEFVVREHIKPSLAELNARIDEFFQVAAAYRQVHSAPPES